MTSTGFNIQTVYSLFVSKETIENSLMTTFKGKLYADTYNKYKQIHKLSIDIQSMIDDTDKYKSINPLEQKSHEVSIPHNNSGVILVLPITFLLDPVKLDLTNILNSDGSVNITESISKLNIIFDSIHGYTYLLFDINRNIICLHDLYISTSVLGKLPPANTTPYLNTVIDSNFLALRYEQILYGLTDKFNLSNSTFYPSPESSFIISDHEDHEDHYKLWGKILMESIINTLTVFPYSATIWISIDINNVKVDNWFDIMANILLYTGFSNPYFSTKDPLNKDYNYKFVGLTKKNDIKFVSTQEISNEYNNILYLFNQNVIECDDNKKKTLNCLCTMKLFFDKQTILWLLRLPFNTQTININTDGSKNLSQKEFSGAFKIKAISCEKNISTGTSEPFYYINKEGNTVKGYIISLDKVNNTVKILPDWKYQLKSDINDEDFEYIDVKKLSEPCSYNINNFVAELELDTRSVNYTGQRVTTYDNLIDNIKRTYQNSSSNTLQHIKNTLSIISNNLNTLRISNEYHEKIKRVVNKTEASKIKDETDSKIKKEYIKIKAKTDVVEKEIKKVIDNAENNITNIIDTLIKNNISDLGSILSGKENSVLATTGLIQFHTHPYGEYQKNNWTICFPSGPDFASFLHFFIMYNTIASAVITVEGLYIISINYNMCREGKLNQLRQAFNNTNLNTRILYSFDFVKSEYSDPEAFCRHINSLTYNDKEFCYKYNKLIKEAFSSDFYVDEIVLLNNLSIAKILNIQINPKDGKKYFKLLNEVTGTTVEVLQENITKHPIKEFYKKDFTEKNMDKPQNIENDLKFLYGFLASPIFKCEFKTWEQLLQYDNKFNITYSQRGNQCNIDHETIDIMSELYDYPGHGNFYDFNINISAPTNLPTAVLPRTSTGIPPISLETSLGDLSTDMSLIGLQQSLGDDSFNDSF